MHCSVTDLRSKQVVNAKTGCRIGTVFDVLVDTHNGCLVALIIYTGKGILGFCGKGEEMRIPWTDISVIGDEIILVNVANC